MAESVTAGRADGVRAGPAVEARVAAIAAAHRERLLAGLGAAINEKGFAATTIADIVRHAHVSKRTFYEHFPDKEACCLALFATASERMIDAIGREVTDELPWEERIRATIHAYLSGFAASPSLTTTFLLEIRAGGPRTLGLRRAVINRLADALLELAADARAQDPSLRRLDRRTATAIIGGINELMLVAVEEQRVHRLAEIGDTAAELMRSALAPRLG
jgi:AcrR family transcriptional regulator